jgi:hypothetical protein
MYVSLQETLGGHHDHPAWSGCPICLPESNYDIYLKCVFLWVVCQYSSSMFMIPSHLLLTLTPWLDQVKAAFLIFEIHYCFSTMLNELKNDNVSKPSITVNSSVFSHYKSIFFQSRTLVTWRSRQRSLPRCPGPHSLDNRVKHPVVNWPHWGPHLKN